MNRLKKWILGKNNIFTLYKSKSSYINLHWSNIIKATQIFLSCLYLPLALVLSVVISYYFASDDIFHFSEIKKVVYPSIKYIFLILFLIIFLEIVKKRLENKFIKNLYKFNLKNQVLEILHNELITKKQQSIISKIMYLFVSVITILWKYIYRNFPDFDLLGKILKKGLIENLISKKNMNWIINLVNPLFNSIILIGILYICYRIYLPNCKLIIFKSLKLIDKWKYENLVYNYNKNCYDLANKTFKADINKKPDEADAIKKSSEKTDKENNCAVTSTQVDDDVVKKYNDFFGYGFVNMYALIEDKSDAANINTINEVVEYIKSQGDELRLKTLNIVNATKEEYLIDVRAYLKNISHFDSMNIIALILTFFFTFSINLRKDQIKLIDFVSIFVICFAVLVILPVIKYRCKLKSAKRRIKYLTYLEKELESDIEVKNDENNNAETNNEESDK